MSTLAKKYIFKALCEKPQNKQPLPKHLNTSEKKKINLRVIILDCT